jgi:hypothetical protein
VSQETDGRLLERLLLVYEVDWNCLVKIPGTRLRNIWSKLMGSVDILMKSLLMVSQAAWRIRLMIVSRKAAITAEAQSAELDSMSSTFSSTLTGLKERSAQSAESAATLSSNLLDNVRCL